MLRHNFLTAFPAANGPNCTRPVNAILDKFVSLAHFPNSEDTKHGELQAEWAEERYLR